MPGLSITRVFFDSDTIIAGSASRKGASFILLQLAELGLIQGIASQKVIEECRRNVQLKLPDALPQFEKIISHTLAIVDNPPPKLIARYNHMANEKGVPILAAAIQQKVQFLVTFNTKDYFQSQDLLLYVVEPGELLQRIRHRLSQMSER